MEPMGWAAAIGAAATVLLLVLKWIGAARDERSIKRDKLAEVEAKESDDAMARVDAELDRLRRNGSGT